MGLRKLLRDIVYCEDKRNEAFIACFMISVLVLGFSAFVALLISAVSVNGEQVFYTWVLLVHISVLLINLVLVLLDLFGPRGKCSS